MNILLQHEGVSPHLFQGFAAEFMADTKDDVVDGTYHGEPHCYKPALDEAGAILAELGEKTEPEITSEAA